MMPTRHKKPSIPPPEELTSSVQEAHINSGFGERVFKARMEAQMTQASLAKFLKRNRSSVAQWERGKNIPDIHTIEEMAGLMNTTPQWLAFGISDRPQTVMPDPKALGYALVPEIRVGQTPDKFETIHQWALPYSYLTSQLGATSGEALFILRVESSIHGYQIDDRVIVDRSSVRPSPPGIFVIWDGLACVLAKLGLIPGGTKNLEVRVEDANGTYDVALDKLTVLGRVRGSFQQRR